MPTHCATRPATAPSAGCVSEDPAPEQPGVGAENERLSASHLAHGELAPGGWCREFTPAAALRACENGPDPASRRPDLQNGWDGVPGQVFAVTLEIGQ